MIVDNIGTNNQNNINAPSAVNKLSGILKNTLPDDTDMRSGKEQRLKEKLEQTDR